MFLKGAVQGVAISITRVASSRTLYCVWISLPRSDLRPMALKEATTARCKFLIRPREL